MAGEAVGANAKEPSLQVYVSAGSRHLEGSSTPSTRGGINRIIINLMKLVLNGSGLLFWLESVRISVSELNRVAELLVQTLSKLKPMLCYVMLYSY